MRDFDLVIRNGTVVTASDRSRCDVGVKAGKVIALGAGLTRGALEIDAQGKLVLPGGVDCHVQFCQPSPVTGVVTATDFVSGTIAAACGGNTTVMPYVRQERGQSLRQAVEDYHRRAHGKAMIDYAFHLTVTDPTPQVLGQELPALIHDGYTSVKVYMTFDSLKLSDYEILKLLALTRDEGAMVMVHAENADCVRWLTERLLERGLVAPRYVTQAHPAAAEREATHRAITLAEIADAPVLIVNVASAEAAGQIEWGQRRGLKVYAETCPQYLFLTCDVLETEGAEGAKWVCSPALGGHANREALWAALEAGVFQTVSSDHVAHRFGDPKGKLVEGPNTTFDRVTCGVPGIEVRMPLLFSGGVQTGRIDLHTFVALTATNPAKLFGLYPRKGTIAVGSDADIVVWDPEREVTVSVDLLHDGADYTPYEGMTVRGWPDMTLSRGEIVHRDFNFVGRKGHGQYLSCERPILEDAPGPVPNGATMPGPAARAG